MTTVNARIEATIFDGLRKKIVFRIQNGQVYVSQLGRNLRFCLVYYL